MKSDVSEFLKETKPSLIKLLSTQVEAERGKSSLVLGEERNYTGKIGATLFVLVSLGVLAVGGYIAYRLLQKAPQTSVNVLIPQALFAVDTSETVQISSTDKGALTQKLNTLGNQFETGATMKRLIILIEEGRNLRAINAGEFLRAANIETSPFVTTTFTTPIMPVYLKTGMSPLLALVAKTNDPDRVREEFLKNEHNLAFDWSAIFLNEKPPISITIPYKDKIYRNITYRSLVLDTLNGKGIFYAVYPAKSYFIITTTEEALKTIINRMYESG